MQPPPSAGSRTTSQPPGPPEITRGRISNDCETLSLVIGVAANDPTSVAVANTAADQLRSVGIAATVLALDPPVLYGDALANNRVDAIVGWHAAGVDLATLLASPTMPTGTAPVRLTFCTLGPAATIVVSCRIGSTVDMFHNRGSTWAMTSLMLAEPSRAAPILG